MSYFEKFPKIVYTQDDYLTGQVVPDVLRRASVISEVIDNVSFYDLYDVEDGETPEIVADRYYNDPTLHWLVLLTNEVIDPRFAWPLSTNNLIEFCNGKYGANVYSTHHWENTDGYIVNSDEVGATPISNFTYEDRLNEERRRIKIIVPELVSTIVSEFDTLINK